MTIQTEAEIQAKPRLVLMGEFSSGKSTLSNILLGGATLPMQVTATRLPPVHITYGEPGAFALTRAGARIAVHLSDLGMLSPDEILSLHLTMKSDTLELCDLIDMPGISDPNMPTDTWDAIVRSSDHVIWCTHATQAWRQSEAAAWDNMREATSGENFLLITQFDKLRSARDRSRVLNRVITETAGKFTAVYPVSLRDALASGDDFDAWTESGANAFMEHLIETLIAPKYPPALAAAQLATEALVAGFAEPAEAGQAARPDPHCEIARPIFNAAERAADTKVVRVRSRILPRRIKAKPGGSHLPRPPRSTGMDVLAWHVEQGAT